MQKVLLVDDEQGIRESLTVMLQIESFQVNSAKDAHSALLLLNKNSNYDFILCDIKMPGMNGLKFLKEIKQHDINSIIIMITAYGNVETAIEAVQNGADDYITKPIKTEELILRMKMAEEKIKLKKDNYSLRQQLGDAEGMENIVSVSKHMKEIKELSLKAARYKTTVLITGESGTGKELVAKSIHNNSERKDGPFVAVNCAAIPDTLIESELFGYMKGAFSGASDSKLGLIENANGGTLFLDEIGEFPLHLQSKLLRVLQEEEIRRLGDNKERKIDVRVIAATNRDLEQDVSEKKFREDLYYRINVLQVNILPLRQRKEDIPYLINFFVESFNNRFGKKVKEISKNVLSQLLHYPWYGNVRELENAIERSMILSDKDVIDSIDLPKVNRNKNFALDSIIENLSLDEAKQRVEQLYIEDALDKTRGNRTKAAELLGISRRNLLYKLKDFST